MNLVLVIALVLAGVWTIYAIVEKSFIMALAGGWAFSWTLYILMLNTDLL